jgi:DNA-binding transcriptional LysR family regulator
MKTSDIKLAEIELFLSLLKLKSIREVARQKNMQPGQVSKWISSLERKVGAPLINRASTGVTPTARALELLPVFEDMHVLLEKLSGKTQEDSKIFSIASSSFFSTHLVPEILKEIKNTKFRLIDLPPTSFVTAGLRGSFQYCLHSQKLDWPQTWSTKETGKLRWNLYCRKNHPLTQNSGMKNILKYPFIIPIYWTPDGTQFGNDQCPIPMSKRIKGHETATAASAAQIANVTDQLAFLPEVVASRSDLQLEKVKVPWKQVETPVYLSVKNSVVKQNDFEKLIKICTRIL